jgi:hypothetical protein
VPWAWCSLSEEPCVKVNVCHECDTPSGGSERVSPFSPKQNEHVVDPMEYAIVNRSRPRTTGANG